MRLLLPVVLCSACSFRGGGSNPGSEPDAPDVPDGPADAAIDAVMEGIDFLPASEETFSSRDWTIDTNTLINTTMRTIVPPPSTPGVVVELGMQDNGQQVAILRLKDFKVAAGRVLFATGDKPLVILAGHDVTIDGRIDVGAHTSTRGPGGAVGAAGPGAGGPSVHDDGTGSTYDDTGGGGGSFGTAGARGGNVLPFLGGAAGAPYNLDGLVGGASGGTAGACTNPPGAGGGALLLYGLHKIQIMGAITAGGGGGSGGVMVCTTGSGAGAGGGSGGTIWIETPDLDGTGVLAANGGGGGGGSYVGIADGGPGEDGKPSVTDDAQGGSKANTVEASVGGSGAIRGTAAAMVPDLTVGNAGGGGGGLGRIVYHANTLGTLQSSPTAVPP